MKPMMRFKLLFSVVLITAVTAGCSPAAPIPEKAPSDMPATAAIEESPLGESASNSGDYVLPLSGTARLEDQQVYGLLPDQVSIARNEIAARHGYIFKTAALQTYFESKPWYRADPAFSYDTLSAVEKYNMALLKFFESMNTPSAPPNPSPSGIELYKPGQEIHADLNSDGTEETILWFREEMHAVLKVNNLSVEAEGDYFSETFGIADIDPSDGMKEILISDLGPSDDYTSTFYCFNGEAIQRMGQTGGLADYGIVLDGKGGFLALARGSLLQTWFFNRSYDLDSSHQIREVKKDTYPTHASVFVKQPVQIFSERNLSKPSFKLSEGTTATITATDDRQWCQVETEGGKQGWFALKDFNILTTEGIPASEAFFGLSNAD